MTYSNKRGKHERHHSPIIRVDANHFQHRRRSPGRRDYTGTGKRNHRGDMLDRVTRRREYDSRLPAGTMSVTRGTPWNNRGMKIKDFRAWVWNSKQAGLREEFMRTVRYQNIRHLACWCENDCHADVWIEVWEVLAERETLRLF